MIFTLTSRTNSRKVHITCTRAYQCSETIRAIAARHVTRTRAGGGSFLLAVRFRPQERLFSLTFCDSAVILRCLKLLEAALPGLSYNFSSPFPLPFRCIFFVFPLPFLTLLFAYPLPFLSFRRFVIQRSFVAA